MNLGKRIKKLRELNGIRQEHLAKIIGISRPAISQIENGERKVNTEELIKISKVFNMPIDSLLNPDKQPKVILEEKERGKDLEPQIRINMPQKNLVKFQEVFLYILNKVGSKPNIGETVIYKLLYFIDFDYYEKYEEQLIGASYQKNHHGPTPIEFKKVIDRMIEKKEIEKIQSKYFNYPQAKYLPLRKPDLTKLKASEIELIDNVLNRLSDMNAKQISDYSHNDVPWLTAKEGEIIEYESVFYRTELYSMRDYGAI